MKDRARKRIAVFMADLQSEYHRQTMEGIIKQANALNYDVTAFSFFSNHDIDLPFQTGEENILNLFNPSKADGIIVYQTSFRKQSLRDRIIEICIDSGLPYIEIDRYDNEKEFIIWNDREIFKRLVSHLIEVHSLKKIYCLTGYKGYHQSEHRLEGYRDAMREHNLSFDSSWEFYGDFWEEAAAELAGKIISGEIEKPEAVACANGGMAISLTNALIDGGIGVPSDIAVVGYDSFSSNAFNTPTVTAMSDINYNQGINAVCRLHKKITGEICDASGIRPERVEPGMSCGCSDAESRLIKWYKTDLQEQIHYIDLLQVSTMMQQICAQENLTDFSNVLRKFTYLIRGLKDVYICICDDWDGINNTKKSGYRVSGYSENMIMFHLTGSLDKGYSIFSSEEVLPAIYSSLNPSAYYFVPLHFEDRCFGFAAVEFKGEQYSFDRQFWTWTDNISTAIETIRIRNYIRRFSGRIHLTAVRDPLTGIYNRRGFEEFSSEMFEQAIINKEKFLLIAVDIDNLRDINNEFGYSQGDDIIIAVADALNGSCKGNEICCRCGEDNFYLIGCMDYNAKSAQEHIDMIKRNCSKNFAEFDGGMHIELDTGYFCDKIGDEISLSEIIILVNKEIEQKRMDDKKRITYLKSFAQLRKQIYSQPQKKWNIDDMSQMLLLSRAYFQRLYKKEFGVSAVTDVITARIALAKRLLVSERRSIAEIAAMCGYESEIYFMQQFKKETGMTPSQYRKENEKSR